MVRHCGSASASKSGPVSPLFSYYGSSGAWPSLALSNSTLLSETGTTIEAEEGERRGARGEGRGTDVKYKINIDVEINDIDKYRKFNYCWGNSAASSISLSSRVEGRRSSGVGRFASLLLTGCVSVHPPSVFN